jgi:hypothetical protein
MKEEKVMVYEIWERKNDEVTRTVLTQEEMNHQRKIILIGDSEVKPQ